MRRGHITTSNQLSGGSSQYNEIWKNKNVLRIRRWKTKLLFSDDMTI